MTGPGNLHEVSRSIGRLEEATLSLGRTVTRVEAKIDDHHVKVDQRVDGIDAVVKRLAAKVDDIAIDKKRTIATVSGLSAGVGFVSSQVWLWIKGLAS